MARIVRDKTIKPKVRVAKKPKGPPKPTILDEDIADIVITLQRMKEDKTIPFEEVLRKYGYKMED